MRGVGGRGCSALRRTAAWHQRPPSSRAARAASRGPLSFDHLYTALLQSRMRRRSPPCILRTLRLASRRRVPRPESHARCRQPLRRRRRPVSATPIGELPEIDADAVLAHTKALASDEFEGRGPGTKGEELTVDYLVDQFKKIGLKPGNTDGTLRPEGAARRHHRRRRAARRPRRAPERAAPEVDGRGRGVDEARRRRRRARRTRSWCSSATASSRPSTTGTTTKGVDVKGKTLVMLVNDPPVPDPGNPSQLDPKMFGGRR